MPETTNVRPFRPAPRVSYGVTIASRRDSCPHCMIEVRNAPALAVHVVDIHRATLEEAIEIVRERV